MEPIYAVAIEMSSPNRVVSSSLKNEGMTLEVNYLFSEKIRAQIVAIRTFYKKPMYKNCLEFFTLFLCKESQKAEIQESVDKAQLALQAIDKSLKAKVQFMALDMQAVEKGETYQGVISAIEFRVLSDLAEKIKKVVDDKEGQLPERSQKALLKMVDHLEKINVLDDKNITAKLKKVREQIISGTVQTLKDDMEKEITMLRDRGAFLEFK